MQALSKQKHIKILCFTQLLRQWANPLGCYANRKIIENPRVLQCLMASGRCYGVIYLATKVWFGACKAHERAEIQLHDVQSWRQTVQRACCTTVQDIFQGWEPTRLKFET